MLSSPDKLQQRKLRHRCIDLDHRIGLEHQCFRKRACRPKPSSAQLHQPSRGVSTGSLEHLLFGVTRINHPEPECTKEQAEVVVAEEANEQASGSEGVYEQTAVGEEMTEQMTVDEVEASKMGAPLEMAERLSVQLEDFDLSLLCDNPEDFKREMTVLLRNRDLDIHASAELADIAGPKASQEVVDETVASRDVIFGERHGYQLSGSYIKHRGSQSTWQYVCAEEASFIRSASIAAAGA